LNKKDKIGNYVAVGTFEPYIELWDLDVVDPFEPICVLGFNVKKKKENKDAHKGAVLGLSWNTKYTSISHDLTR
jgi:periodic tryptophan protein 1